MTRIRGAVTVALALAAALAGSLAGVAPASAATAIDPSTVTTLEIHKFEQPDAIGQASTGLPRDTTGLVPVPGSTFAATRVPGIDLTSNAGQQAAASLSLVDAGALIAGLPVDAADSTDASGDATLAPLGVGLYYVRETATPSGSLPAEPFLVALPLTDPEHRDHWLTTVHVYPKEARVGIVLDVHDETAVTVGETVGWRVRAGIPLKSSIDGYRITQTIDPGLTLKPPSIHISLGCGGSSPPCPTLAVGVDYTVTVAPGGTGFTVELTAAGREVLADAVHAHLDSAVVVDFSTVVDGEGAFVNTATLAASRATIVGAPGAPPAVSDTAETRWGPLAILVREEHHPENLIPGARFKLYRTAADAAAGTNAITVGSVAEWTTDQNGRIDISGLRFSDFVGGLQRNASDPLYRQYYVVLTGVPSGYEGASAALGVTVTSTTEAQLVVLELRRGGSAPGLPFTGVQLAGIGTIAAVLFAAGFVFLVAGRRRRKGEEAPA